MWPLSFSIAAYHINCVLTKYLSVAKFATFLVLGISASAHPPAPVFNVLCLIFIKREEEKMQN